jgi:hypothetical protein
MLALSWLGAVVLAAAPAVGAPCTPELFRISNNRTRSVVVYLAAEEVGWGSELIMAND